MEYVDGTQSSLETVKRDAAGAGGEPASLSSQLAPARDELLLAPLEVKLSAVEAAIVSTSRRFSRERLIYAAGISFLLGLTLGTILLFTYGTYFLNPKTPHDPQAAAGGALPTTEQPSVPVQKDEPEDPVQPASTGAAESPADRTLPHKPAPTPAVEKGKVAEKAPARGGYILQVLMNVENGRVTSARVLNPRAGGHDYEALALRMARQRRYPDTFSGVETLKLKIAP